MSSRPELFRRTIAAADLAINLKVLADLLDAGMSVNRALTALEGFVTEPMLSVLPVVQAELRQGRGLAAGLDVAGIGIPPIVIGMIGAGENGGGLAASVRHAAAMMEEAASFRAALAGALAYPALLLASGAASVAVLVLMVLPRFAGMLEDMGQALPASTAAVLATSRFAQAAFGPGLFASAATVALWSLWIRTERGRQRWHSVLLTMPVLGGVRFAAATSRSCGALSSLLESGLPLGAALPLAARATGDAALQPRFAAARQLLSGGASLSRALTETSAVTTTGARLVRAGEESGRLAAMLGHASRLEGDRAARVTRTTVRLLEPLLIIVFGGVVALIAGALLQAVYSVRPGA